ncbi:MAG: hypothetical protein M9932_17705 [Xanthobacteraceae bacterium]|nr:hypothetical protein [Xanthobacteraceae bacterium]
MEIAFDFSSAKQRTTISAKSQQYDSPTLKPLEIFAVPYLQNPDRLHVAAALLFHKEMAGLLDLGNAITCSRHVAIQIERFFAPIDISVKNQSFTPTAIPRGEYIAALGVRIDDNQQPVLCDTKLGEILVRFVPEAVGAMFSESEVAIGTNLLHGQGSLDASCDHIIRLLGAAVLFCEEFQISGLRLPSGWQEPSTIQRLEKAAALLSAVSLTLEWSQHKDMAA